MASGLLIFCLFVKTHVFFFDCKPLRVWYKMGSYVSVLANLVINIPKAAVLGSEIIVQFVPSFVLCFYHSIIVLRTAQSC